MVGKKVQKMQNFGASDRHSLCSDQYPFGRFPKVSIGIMVESCPKMGSLVRKEDAAALPDRGRTSSHQGKIVEEIGKQHIEEKKGLETVETLELKQAEDKDQKASAWFSSRSVLHGTPIRETVQFYANRTSVVQSKDGVHRKSDTTAYGKRKEKSINTERLGEVVEEVAFATMQETHLLDKGVGREKTEKVATCNNGMLKMKLWEILGTAPSQKQNTTNSPNLEEEKENFNINYNTQYQRGNVSQPKHNSDTIETDSESPNQTTRRPITRSLTRRRASPKTASKLQSGIKNGKKALYSSCSDSKLKLQENNIFAFDEERKAESLERTVCGHSNQSKGKRNEGKTARNEPQRIYSHRPLVSQNGLQHNVREQKVPSPVESSLQSKETKDSPSLPCQSKTDFMRTPNMQKKARMGPHGIYSHRDLTSEKNLQPNKKETTASSPDEASLQSRETRGSPSPCQSKKDFMETLTLQKTAKIESQKINSLGRLVSEENFMPSGREHTVSSLDRASVQNKEVPNESHCPQTDAHKDFGNTPVADNAGTDEIIDDPLSRKKTKSWEHVMSPSSSKDSDQNKKVASPPLEIKRDLLDDFPSPTLAMNATPPSSSSSELPDEILSSPVPAQPIIPASKGYISKILDNSISDSSGSDANTEFSGDTGKILGSRDSDCQHMKEKETRKKSSLSPMEVHDTESCEADDFPSKDFRQTDKWFPNAGSPTKSPSKLSHSRSVCHRKSAISSSGLRQAENWFSDAGSPQKSPFALRQSKRVKSPNTELRTGDTIGSHKASEPYPENSLESDVVELALVLERFKAKLKSHTRQRSSEILSTAADKIRLKLQDLESQMKDDVGKLINAGKSKRKRFESRIQGQQERLRLMHDKFKEEVNRQILDCQNTMEELQPHQMELKGAIDMQKASHKKLLLQVEDAMKAELKDAETRIAAIDKEARKKMFGLKHVLKEWMEDGVIR